MGWTYNPSSKENPFKLLESWATIPFDVSQMFGKTLYTYTAERENTFNKNIFLWFRRKSIGRTSGHDPLSVWISKPANLLILWVMTTFTVSQSKMVHVSLMPIFDLCMVPSPPLPLQSFPLPDQSTYCLLNGWGKDLGMQTSVISYVT